MKKVLPILFIAFLSNSIFAQTYNLTSHAGDNFSLEAALALFKTAKSVDEFELLINNQANNVTNLDLNNDGKTDYIYVNAIKDNDAHVLVLSTDLNATQKQDIATINIEKTADNQATLQIIGNTALYAENTIIEPFETAEPVQNTNNIPNAAKIKSTAVIVNVWSWPSIQFIYAPTYVVWHSPYHWARYPRWCRPWRPFGYQTFYARCTPYRIYYRSTPNYRVTHSQNLYVPSRRLTSLTVNKRHTTLIRSNTLNQQKKRELDNRNIKRTFKASGNRKR